MDVEAMQLWSAVEELRTRRDEQGEPLTSADMTLLRVLSIGEEFGEATEALNGAIGADPSRPARPWSDVEDELADVVIAAAVALDTISGDARAALERRLRFQLGRVLDSSAPAP